MDKVSCWETKEIKLSHMKHNMMTTENSLKEFDDFPIKRRSRKIINKLAWEVLKIFHH